MKMLTPQNSRSRHGQIWSHGLSQVVCCVAGSWKPPRAARPHHGPIPSHPIPSRPREPRGLPAAMPGTARFFHLHDDRAPPLSTGDWTPIHACRLRAGSAQVSRLSRTANERPRGRTLPRAGPWRCGHRPVAWRQVEAVVLGILEPSDPKATDGV